MVALANTQLFHFDLIMTWFHFSEEIFQREEKEYEEEENEDAANKVITVKDGKKGLWLMGWSSSQYIDRYFSIIATSGK